LIVRERPIDKPSSGDSVDTATEQDEVVNAATILEFLAWGKRKEVSYATVLPPHTDSQHQVFDDAAPYASDEFASSPNNSDREDSSLQNLQILLPDQNKVTAMVEYHVNYLLWFHGSFHGPTFRQQLQTFFDCHLSDLVSPDVDMLWVALLFSVLTGAISCGDKMTVLAWGFDEAEQEMLSSKWFQATVTCLNTADYMARHSILACEAIATLTISAHILGYSNQQAILLASAVRIAQSLGLHRLTDSVKKTLEREIGKRVWAQLCSQDWFSIPFSECYLVNPLYSRTTAPINCDDITLDDSPDTIPTVTSYCRYLHSIAALMPGLQDGITRSNTLFTKYDQVMTFDRKMRKIASEQRPVFLSNTPLDPSWPRWIIWARRAAAISSSHKIIMIHRNFLVLSFTNSAFEFTRRTCIAASKTILKEVASANSEGGPVLWIFHAFTVAAGVTLCLDALHRRPTDPARMEHCRLVGYAIDQLRLAHNSSIASRGTTILVDLLRHESATRSNYNKRRAENMSGDAMGPQRQHKVDIRHVVRKMQRRTSPQASRPKRQRLLEYQAASPQVHFPMWTAQ
jgi:hypothetical protein